MAVTAQGITLDLDGPLPVPPQHTLLSVPGVLVEDGDRWLNGVDIYGYPTEVPYPWDVCATGTFREKEEGGEPPVPRFNSFGIYLPITCSAMGIGDWRDFAERAEAVLLATSSYAVEVELSKGTSQITGDPNPFFGDANVTVLGGAAVTPAVGLSWLERAIALTGRAGMIHAAPEVVSAWGFDKLLEDGEGVLRTANGTPVVSGGGYVDAEADGQAPGSGNSYAFATGPVEVRLSELTLVGDDIVGTLDTSTNLVTFRAERFALATWDTALQSAVLIDWTP